MPDTAVPVAADAAEGVAPAEPDAPAELDPVEVDLGTFTLAARTVSAHVRVLHETLAAVTNDRAAVLDYQRQLARLTGQLRTAAAFASDSLTDHPADRTCEDVAEPLTAGQLLVRYTEVAEWAGWVYTRLQTMMASHPGVQAAGAPAHPAAAPAAGQPGGYL